MFGVVPKSIWQRTNPADENNMCTWAMRSLLVEDGNRLILIDTGIGDKQDEKFLRHYFLHGDENLDGSLAAAGFSRDDITDVFLSHLHFDHCGGSVQWMDSDRTILEPAFKNATFWSNADHWKWATEPNRREKASFLAENILPMEESGQLKFIERTSEFMENIFPNFSVLYANGHTEGMMIPHLSYQGKTVVFMADLLPSVGHIPVPFVMGYDTRPLITLNEKEAFLKKAADEEYILYFQHDPENECCTLQHTEKGVRLKDTFSLKDAFS